LQPQQYWNNFRIYFGLSGMRLERGVKMLNSEIGQVFELLYRCDKTRQAAKLLVEWLISRGGYATPSELSGFAWKLQRGLAERGFTYRRSSLYRTVIRRLLDFCFINQQQVYDAKSGRVVQAYVLVRQPTPKRPPLGGKSFWKLAWHISRAWNYMIEHGVTKA
jgi:hypothetical protein